MAAPGRGPSVLAIFCQPKGTDALRLQSEHRILQRALKGPCGGALQVCPAATLNDLREALDSGATFDRLT